MTFFRSSAIHPPQNIAPSLPCTIHATKRSRPPSTRALNKYIKKSSPMMMKVIVARLFRVYSSRSSRESHSTTGRASVGAQSDHHIRHGNQEQSSDASDWTARIEAEWGDSSRLSGEILCFLQIARDLECLYKDQRLTDFMIIAGDKEIAVHKAILSARQWSFVTWGIRRL